uniref:ILEI/PANDER domain-containing protein n=1 Tax=Amphilophus citrinellus TaxID=61819 RepID=A0A3Q0SRT9_AMPCI
PALSILILISALCTLFFLLLVAFFRPLPISTAFFFIFKLGTGVGINESFFPPPAGPCRAKRECPADQFSFYIHSGAANVVPPVIFFKMHLYLSGVLVEVVCAKFFYDVCLAEVKPLIDFLNIIEKGSIVIIASYDEPATKLNDEARKLIADLGSSAISSVGYRDNWVFVGAKGATLKTHFEKHLKNEAEKNKYDGWPEMIELDGCVPKYLE